MILACEVECLSWEIPDDIGQVTSPEGGESLLLDDSGEAVTNTTVSVLRGDVLVGVLHLEEKLDSLDGGHKGLGNGSGSSTDEEVGDEALLLFFVAHISYLFAL